MATILIVDDDFAVRTSLKLLLKKAGFTTFLAESPFEAQKILKSEKIGLVILDMNFSMETSGKEGLDFLKEIKSQKPNLSVILITAWGSISLAVQGMKFGANDFLSKPWNNSHLVQTVKTALSLSKNDTNHFSRKDLDKAYNFKKIIGEDPKLLSILTTAGKIAETNASVLILGESGTGKELLAEAIHQNSQRKNKNFVKVNLGGISSTLFESEMFGHKKGSFTDAKTDRIGRFELADEGTIFLDEIGELDISNQVKLLRVLQDRTFEILGSSKTKTSDFRIVSATNQNLEELVNQNNFREDLFYRINLITLKIPSLRERPNDIPLLAKSFLNNLNESYKREIQISTKALNWLKSQSWFGNIRELKNLIERVFLVSTNSILEVENFEAMQSSIEKKSTKSLPEIGAMTLEEIEKEMVQKALTFHKNNVSKAAKSLGLSRAAFYRRLEKFGLAVNED
ncbi:MAG: sigma-54-dependent Fis family transcriptional regulator [Calditrichaeota bacterium]|nr:MAG: sigma-54-dependent Fis family transcriptional regulator [Calditrichota bacterium]